MSETTKTSQSIFVILDSLETETSVPGQIPKMQRHTLKRESFPTSKQFESEEDLKNWAIGAGCLHACLQKGVKAHLIDCRARFKSCKKNDTWTNEYGQANLDAFDWEVQERPNGGNKEKIDKAVEEKLKAERVGMLVKQIKMLQEFGATIEQIKEKLIKDYPENLVNTALGLLG